MARYDKSGLNSEDYKKDGLYFTPKDFKDPKSGKNFVQTNERMLSHFQLKKILKINRFQYQKVIFLCTSIVQQK